MATVDEKARAARALRDQGFAVSLICELLDAGQSTVYDWLGRESVLDSSEASVRASLEERIASRDDLSESPLLALARQAASKLDQMAESDKALDSQSYPQMMKGYRDLVTELLGSSQSRKEWLIGVFAEVGHSPDPGA